MVSIFSYGQNEDYEKDLEMALRPSKATFYSAVLPGLGQAYNKKYWKIPIVYSALATGLYFYNENDKNYKRYRNAYKRRLAGFTDDEFYGNGASPSISDDGLIRAQSTLKRNKELSTVRKYHKSRLPVEHSQGKKKNTKQQCCQHSETYQKYKDVNKRTFQKPQTFKQTKSVQLYNKKQKWQK